MGKHLTEETVSSLPRAWSSTFDRGLDGGAVLADLPEKEAHDEYGRKDCGWFGLP